MPDIEFWHNPRCSKSRAALALLQERGIEPAIRDYLWQPPDIAELRGLLRRLGIPARELVRTGEAEYAALAPETIADEEALLAVMVAHPRLIERPILVVGERAIVARPAERMLEVL